MIDTHAHLNDKAFDSDRQEVLERAWRNGVESIIDVSEDLKSALASIKLFEREKDVWSTAGLHPHLACRLSKQDLDQFRELLRLERVVAIGEIGLDYYYENQPRDIQKETFCQMLDLALESDFPVIIHNRDSDRDLIRLISERAGKGLRGVIHCFTGGLELARTFLDLSFYLSFSGIVTFRNAIDLREVVREVPLDRILIETDAPYLTPHPMRGERNEPAYVQYTTQEVARIKGLDPFELGHVVTENARKLFTRMT